MKFINRISSVMLFAAAAGLFLSGCMEEGSEETQETLQRREIIAYRTDEEIIIDGNLDEPAWEKAFVVDNFNTWIDGKIQPAHSRTEVRVLWDDEYLYIGAEMQDEDIYALHTEKNSRTWEDDVFEIFIKPFTDKHGYYELHVTPINTTLQLFSPRRHMRGSYEAYVFEGGMRSAVSVRGELNNWRVRDDGWTAEIAVPFSAFSETAHPPEPGTVWTAAFCRYDYSYYVPESYERGRELSSSAALSSANFHLHEDYDRLVFAVHEHETAGPDGRLDMGECPGKAFLVLKKCGDRFFRMSGGG